MIGLALAALGAALGGVALAGQADGRTMPNIDEVRSARFAHLNGACVDHPDLCHHSAGVDVRRLRCTRRSAGRSRCAFEEQVTIPYNRPRWRRASYGFVFDPARARWSIDCRSETAQPSGAVIIRCD